jgi:hypothetical protein
MLKFLFGLWFWWVLIFADFVLVKAWFVFDLILICVPTKYSRYWFFFCQIEHCVMIHESCPLSLIFLMKMEGCKRFCKPWSKALTKSATQKYGVGIVQQEVMSPSKIMLGLFLYNLDNLTFFFLVTKESFIDTMLL